MTYSALASRGSRRPGILCAFFFGLAALACSSDADLPPLTGEPGGTCRAPDCLACGSCLAQCLCATQSDELCLQACSTSAVGGAGGAPASGGASSGGTSGSGGSAGSAAGGASGTSGSGGASGAAGGAGGSAGTAGSGGFSGVGGSAGSGTGGSGGSAPPPPPPPPGDVTWFDYAAQQAATNGSWGWALTDIVQHLPASYGSTYYDSDLVTYGHETTHGIHAHLRNNFNSTGKRANAFYVLNDRAALVEEPGIRKSDINGFVPQSLRESRYSTYLAGASDWDDTPLYIWDEWVAYTNGTKVGLALSDEGAWKSGWRDQFGNLEFTVYGLAVGAAVEAKDPTYWASNDQFRAFMKWQTERAMDHFQRARATTDFEWDKMDAYFEKMKTSPDAETWRAFVKRAHGEEWSRSVMDF